MRKRVRSFQSYKRYWLQRKSGFYGSFHQPVRFSDILYTDNPTGNATRRFLYYLSGIGTKDYRTERKMAWNNLMKVISHELLNTLTPINSLIRNMEYITDQEEISGDDQEEIKESLKIVNNKSEQLLNFINNYRQVAELPKPKLQKISIRPVIEKVLRLMESEFQNKNITLTTSIKDYMIMADEKCWNEVLSTYLQMPCML